MEFLIGRNGMFDLFAASVIREVCKEYDYGNAALVLVLPHITPDYKNNSAMIDKMYDEIEVCEEAECYSNRLSVRVFNRIMSDKDRAYLCYTAMRSVFICGAGSCCLTRYVHLWNIDMPCAIT